MTHFTKLPERATLLQAEPREGMAHDAVHRRFTRLMEATAAYAPLWALQSEEHLVERAGHEDAVTDAAVCYLQALGYRVKLPERLS